MFDCLKTSNKLTEGEVVYGKWEEGECFGECGEGKRNDTRGCLEGECDEKKLRRSVDCKIECVGVEVGYFFKFSFLIALKIIKHFLCI